jgi:riboflavin-specific deaminase-like protein
LQLRRIHPDPAVVTVEEAAASMEFPSPGERPYVVCNMAATADGKATIGGKAGPIGNEADRALFHALRGQVDAVLVGAETLRVERYGRLVRDAERREARVGSGLAADPIAVLVSRSGRVPLDVPLFQDPASTVVVYTSSEAPLGECPATVHVTRLGETRVDLAAALAHLHTEHAVRSLLCEGGPTLLGNLLAGGLVDELFLTVAPRLGGGGTALTIVAGPALPEPVELSLMWALEAGDSLFLRYAVRR